MNARTLAYRDPAAAAAMGALDERSDFGVDFGMHPAGLHGLNPSQADYGTEFGYGPTRFGDDAAVQTALAVGPSHPAHPMNPANQQAVAQMWAQSAAKAQDTKRREMILEPNKGSDLKLERYSFSLSQDIVLGTPAIISQTDSPPVFLRPQRVTHNAPAPGFVYVDQLKVANVSVSSGFYDAYENNANGVGQAYDMPTLNPSNKALISAQYTGFVPPGYTPAAPYKFITTFKGPASVIA